MTPERDVSDGLYGGYTGESIVQISNERITNSFDYHCLRARKARLGKLLNSPALQILMILLIVGLFGGGGYLLFAKNSLAWILIGFACGTLSVLAWSKMELKKVPIGKTEDLNDILSHNLLTLLDTVPTPRKIARIIIQTSSGKFLAYRFGISTEMLDFLASNSSDDPTPIFEKAREIREHLKAPTISGGILAIAMIENYPKYATLLAKMKLEIADLYAGINWYNHLHGLVQDAKKKHHDGGVARDLAFGYIPLLSRFGQNISAGRKGLKTQIHLATHRDTIEKMISIFTSGGRQNVALIGSAGSGRTTIVNAFAEELMDADSKIPSSLKFRQIFMLDAAALISASSSGSVENLVNAILNEAFAAQNIIIYLDNAHLFFEDGTGSVDISNLLAPVLEAGRLRMILTLDEQKFLEISARKPALSNALNKLMVSPADESETMRAMEDQVPIFEYKYQVIYTYWALREAYRLSERYIYDLVMPGRALNLLEASAKYASGGFVLAESVQQAIEATSGVKVSVASSSVERDRLLNMEQLIHERMINQEEAVRTVSDALRRAAAGVRNTSRPIGTFLFLGPTGVGKTELAKALSSVYFGGENQIVRVDLNEYVMESDVARLIADGAGNPSSLTAQVMKQPFSVVLLDEVEKAHPLVLTTLLQMLDEGILRDSAGREVSFRDAIVIMTSNAGADAIRSAVASGAVLEKSALVNWLISSGQFKPEFLNRFDEICVFKPLSPDDLLRVVDLIIAGINQTLEAQKISVVVDDEAKRLLVSRGYDPQLGARPMRRIVQKTVENLVAQAVLSGTASSGTIITITAHEIENQLGK